MNPKPVDSKNPAKGIKENLDHILSLCEKAFIWPPDPRGVQLLAFPEFTLTGFDTIRTRKEWLKIAIVVPGPETERIGQKAKELGCYIEFASHTQDPDWPGHFFNTSLIVSPEGKVIHTHWKAYYNFPGWNCLEYSTTVHDVLDEFIERYGWEGVWPVARTNIGNIATFICSEGFAPETAKAFAMNGAEILIRSIANGGYIYDDLPGVGDIVTRMRSDCIANHVYGIYANSDGGGIFIKGKKMVESAGGGMSMIIDPSGRILSQANDTREQIIHATIPIASFRAKHEPPRIRTEIYAPVLEQHPGYVPPNLYSKYLPVDAEDALQWSLKHLRK